MLEIPDQRSSNSPKYVILAKNHRGDWVEIGNAWEKMPKGHGIGGEPFLSITIDDLSFEHPLVVFAFPQDDETWDITWRRRRGTSKSDAA